MRSESNHGRVTALATFIRTGQMLGEDFCDMARMLSDYNVTGYLLSFLFDLQLMHLDLGFDLADSLLELLDLFEDMPHVFLGQLKHVVHGDIVLRVEVRHLVQVGIVNWGHRMMER